EISAGKRVDSSYKLVSVTQFYTEDYIVKYILDNTLGRYWLEMHPESSLRDLLKYYDTTVPAKSRDKKPVEEITVMDPACGSGHFLLYAMDLLHQMYLDSGHTENIPQKIVENNLYGLDIDERAIQLTALSLYLKAKNLSRKSRLTGSNLYALSMDHFDESDLMVSMGLSDLANPVVRNLMDTLTSLKRLNMIGSLFRMKPAGKKKKVEKTAALMETSDRSMDGLIQRLVNTIEEKLPAQTDAVSALLNGDYAKQFNAIRLLLGEYDIVVTNPPYRDSGTLADDMKTFLKDYYPDSKSDMYSAFIEKCLDLTAVSGFLGMVTMQSFMFISSHEKLRKLLLEGARISSLVHLGPRAFRSIGGEIVNTVMFAIERGNGHLGSAFHSVKDLDYEEKVRTIRETLAGRVPQRAYTLNQSEFKKIPGYPFVYWISDRIRELFRKYKPLIKYADVRQGCATGDNDRFLRFWWEVEQEDISLDYKSDRKKWVPYAKGGPYNKWYGNLWWAVDYSEETYKVLKNMGNKLPSESYYFREGLTFPMLSSAGCSFRYLPVNYIFDHAGNCMFPTEAGSLPCVLAIVNSRVTHKLLSLISSTVNFEVGELKKIPIPDPSALGSKSISSEEIRDLLGGLSTHSPLSTLNSVTLSSLAQDCIELKKELYGFHVMERDFKHDPLTWGLKELREEGRPVRVKDALKRFFLHKADLEARLLINEAVNDELVFKLYGLLPEDLTLLDVITQSGLLGSLTEDAPSALNEGRVHGLGRWTQDVSLHAVLEVLESEGVPAGAYPARELTAKEREKLSGLYLKHRHDRGSGKSEAITGMEFGIVEELANALKASPVTVVEELAKIDALPSEAVKDVLSEHIQALTIEIMREDNDGILSLSTDTAETSLPTRIVKKWRELGIGDTYDELENLLGKKLEEYLLKDFAGAHSKRFMGRPIIWHLVSDKASVNFFVLHHIWCYDRMLLLRSKYLGDVNRTLENTLATETDEKKRERLMEKMEELERLAISLDELSDGSYLPEIDGGVAKNIAPLQKKGLLKYDPLSAKLVAKMLKVEW
ncbi:MAG: BREX-1 system adenine-specific DNA-methyltransferase PglX, partial [Mesotoga sp.]